MYIKLLSLLSRLTLCCEVGWEIEFWLRDLIRSLRLVSFTEARWPGRAVSCCGYGVNPDWRYMPRGVC